MPVRTFAHWLDRPAVAIMLSALLSTLLSLLPFATGHVPQPDVQDEFAHLLAADTFAQGRLTNVSPSLWPFFEAPHVLVQPTYMSKYLPGEGLILALGQCLGQPIVGAYLAAAAGCGAIAWMLLGCLPGRWATLGGCLAASHPLLIWWSQTYWGGGVALLGGALLTGAAIRLARFDEYRPSWAWLAGLGSAVLILSRPFEGGITGVLLVLILLRMSMRRKQIRHVLRPVPILLAIVTATLVWLAYFNYRVTGSPWQLPYTLAARQYMTAPLMYWQHAPTPPRYNNPYLAYFYQGYEWPEYAAQLDWQGFWLKAWEKVSGLWVDFGRSWMLSTLPLLMGLSLLRRDRAAQLSLLIVLGMPAIQIACTPWMRNQYMAPIVGGFFTLLLLGYRRLSQFHWRERRIGAFVIALLLAAQGIQTAATERQLMNPPPQALGIVRKQLIDRLRAENSRRKLVFVRHLRGGSLSDVVYNSADIDSQDIVFARDFGDTFNQRLIEYYKGRACYMLTFETIDLQPYKSIALPVP